MDTQKTYSVIAIEYNVDDEPIDFHQYKLAIEKSLHLNGINQHVYFKGQDHHMLLVIKNIGLIYIDKESVYLIIESSKIESLYKKGLPYIELSNNKEYTVNIPLLYQKQELIAYYPISALEIYKNKSKDEIYELGVLADDILDFYFEYIFEDKTEKIYNKKGD